MKLLMTAAAPCLAYGAGHACAIGTTDKDAIAMVDPSGKIAPKTTCLQRVDDVIAQAGIYKN
ncbi:hypothetical protein F2P45_06455 [Massilia sp. CCM 8733]|uniref:Uncharacterized protein n=1 Tax=Massilia mucilaginosa TaxID=2609282 RepID=A0ABX0NPE8_9BURK|nr:hypothetical protein [Massilia mucilaginosa]NHZ88666.1 hypothetical protein [Massilia mucilaginosa]